MGKRGSELCNFLLKALIRGTYGSFLTWVNEELRIFKLYLVHRSSKEWTPDSYKILMDWHKKNFRIDKKCTKHDKSITDPRQLLLSAMKRSKFLKFFPEESNGKIRIFQFREKIEVNNSFQSSSPPNQLQQFSPDGDSGFHSPLSLLLTSPSISRHNNATIFHGEINNNELLSSLPEPTADLDMYLQQPDSMEFFNYDMDSIIEEFVNDDLKSTENVDMNNNEQMENAVNSVKVNAHKLEMNQERTMLPAVGSPTFQDNFSIQTEEPLIEQNKMVADSLVITLGDRTITIKIS